MIVYSLQACEFAAFLCAFPRSNACKNTGPDGNVDLRIELVARRSPGSATYRFAVSDTGCGIPPEEQERIFQPYAQVGVKRGTGMGLPLPVVILQRAFVD